ncbi:MAG: M23 family metallopeptidase [Gammaproteobacteria bacterium]|nr:M23 family metallopeptidase [Gammaproteobacteria bacterium]
MGLFILPAGDQAVAKLRTVSARRAVLAGSLLLTAALAAGAFIGYHGGRQAALDAAPTIGQGSERVLTERLGTLQGKVLQLESKATDLAARVGAPLPDAEPAGGPYQPLPELGGTDSLLAALVQLESTTNRVAQLLAAAAESAKNRGTERMALPSRMPVAGSRISSGFGRRIDPITGRWARHTGIDFPAPSGTPIVASAGGRVSFAGYRPAYGYSIDIDHGNGLKTRYAHAKRLNVRRGELVLPGQTIGQVGSTGRSTGAHLHFEVLRQGQAVEPRHYLAAATSGQPACCAR